MRSAIPLDANGWATNPLEPLDVEEAWSLISPEIEGRMDVARWAHQAASFFNAKLTLVGDKHYPSGAVPISDCATLEISPIRARSLYRTSSGEIIESTRVTLITIPLDRAAKVLEAARAGAAAIGGAGFDVLVARGRRLWQVADPPSKQGDPRAPLLLAGVLASLFLAPILPPGGGTIFGVKGARERLEQQGYR